MKKLTRNEVAGWLEDQDHFTILTHRKPDGDTIGSAAGLCWILRSLGKTAWVLENPDITPKFAPLLEGITRPEPEDGDILIAVDVATPGMLPKRHAGLAQYVDLRIDHHGSATSFGDAELVDPEAGATAEIIYDIAMELWIDLDQAAATALYVGTATDTGCFRYANTTDHSFLVAAACAQAGAPVFRLNQELFESVTLARHRLQAYMIKNVKLLDGGRYAICAIPKSVEQALELTEDDLENIASFPRTIAGVCMAATLRESADGCARASVRAVPGYNAAAVCEVYGGGGHAGAAGTDIRLPLTQAAAALGQTMMEVGEQPWTAS